MQATISALPDGTSLCLVMSSRESHDETQAASARREAALSLELQGRDRFVAMLAHELRTPLTPALLGVQSLEEDERFAEARPALTMIRRNIELQARLLETLFDFTRLEQGRSSPCCQSVDVHAAIRSAVAICQSELGAQEIQLSLDFWAVR